jgi:hypothetical protein
MMDHSFTQDRHYPNGVGDGKSNCELQTFRCRTCGISGVHGIGQKPPAGGVCAGMVARPKIVRPNPFEGREDDIEDVKHEKHWQQNQKGKRNK